MQLHTYYISNNGTVHHEDDYYDLLHVGAFEDPDNMISHHVIIDFDHVPENEQDQVVELLESWFNGSLLLQPQWLI